ncbi:MAG: type II toxin-antitoxin system Phd/YefM family antitoxin [Verrucomicrobia bacterium]|nr:type II toxin-antitoxin system Phd/YefM family antitoxin [Verrucomicrobiota bacterium]
MKIVTEQEASTDLARLADEVFVTHVPVIIARADGRSVVLLSLDDYESRNDTEYLLSSPANAARLMDAVAAFESKQGYQERDLIDP